MAMKYLDLPFTMRDIPSLDEIRRQEKRLGLSLPAVPLRALLRLMRVGNDVKASIESNLMKHDLSLARFALLAQLIRADHHQLTPSALAQQAGVTRATVTGVLDGLEKRGWVERRTHPEDRRSILVVLTDSGMSFMREILPDHIRYITSMIKDIEEADLARLLKTLDALEANIGEETDA